MTIARILPSLALGAVLAASAGIARASAELHLTDGKVLRGTSVELREDGYVLHLADGSAATIPSDLVRELRLLEDEIPAPTGFRQAPIEVLAGAPRPTRTPRPEEQTKALGPPAKFRVDPVKTEIPPWRYWSPDPARNDFNPSKWAKGVIDPVWRPRSAFDGRKDVLAGGRSRWPNKIFDPVWWPVDGFTKESPGDAPASAAADTDAAGTPPAATPEAQMARARELAEAARSGAGVPTRLSRSANAAIDLAFAAVVRARSRLDPRSPPPVLLATRADLERIASGGNDRCARSRSKRAEAAARTMAAFSEPRIDRRDSTDAATFLSWCVEGGAVVRHVAVLDDDGVRSLRDETVAEHVGNHDEPSSRR